MKYRKMVLLLCATYMYSFFMVSCEKTIDFYPGVSKSVAVSSILKLPDTLDASVYQYYNFNSTIGDWYEVSQCCVWSASVDKQIVRAGNGSMKVELRRNDLPNGHRSELGTKPGVQNEDGWYAVSLYFPSSFTSDSIDDCIIQWQSLPDFTLGEQWRSAPLCLGVSNDKFFLDTRTSAKRVNAQGDYSYNRSDLGLVEKNKWSDWVFHIKWSYDNSGILEIWKNKTKLVSRINLPNSFNDANYPYFKVGIYRYDWDKIANNPITSRTVYVDELKIASKAADLQKMSSVVN